MLIQSKYYAKPKTSLRGFYGKGIELKYPDEESGVLMNMEVPADQYDLVVQRFEKQIAAGTVKVNDTVMTDPQIAKKLVRKGHYTYADTKAMVKLGTCKSVKYDGQTGLAASAAAGCVAFVTTLTVSECCRCRAQHVLSVYIF